MTSRTEFCKAYRDYMTAAARFRKPGKRMAAGQPFFSARKILYIGHRAAGPAA
jgi:hypothetical protein